MSIKIVNKDQVWFTSDTHWRHHNILKYCGRPFKDVSHMDREMIDRWNEKVGVNDIVFHLGDFCFGELSYWENIRRQLNGKIYFIRGNHDKYHDTQLRHLFEGIFDLLEIKVKDNEAERGWQNIVLCHYAMRVWNKSHHGSWHLWGHSHSTLPDDPNALSIDVGVDCHNYAPISYKEVKKIMSLKNWTPVDHHGKTNEDSS